MKNYWFIAVASILLLASCSPAKFVPKGSYILSKQEVVVDNKKISSSAIEGVFQQKPIKKFLGIPFALWVYNLSDTAPSPTKLGRWFDRTFQKLGEAPTVFDSSMYISSVAGIQQYLKTKGYYNAEVTDVVTYTRNKYAHVLVNVKAGQPFRIRDFKVRGTDSIFVNAIKKDSAASLIRRGMIFDTDLLERERERITTNLSNSGYYYFNKTFITYEADTTLGNNEVAITQVIRNLSSYNALADTVVDTRHAKYIVKEVNVFTNFDRVEALTNKEYLSEFEETKADNISIWHHGAQNVTNELVLRALKIKPNEYYNQSARVETDNNFSGLKIFRTIDIQYDTLAVAPSEHLMDGALEIVQPRELVCNIFLSPILNQSYKLEGELYLSSEYWGLEGSLGYMHHNLFKGAELLNVNINGTMPFYKMKTESPISEINKATEFGITTSFNIPRFLIPFNIGKHLHAYAPRTQFTVGYNYQSSRIYTRNLVNFGFGYSWMPSKQLSLSYSPINLNIIKMHNSSDLYDYIKDELLLATAFSNHFIASGKFSAVFNTQRINSLSSYYYAMANFELAGNALSLFNSKMKKYTLADGSNVYSIWDMPYSQFLSSEFTAVFNGRLDSRNRLVYRFQLAFAIPYGNSSGLPFEKYFYVGGANSMRGWQMRGLGPGSYVDTSAATRLMKIGDFKLEANLEYRFKLFWSFEGALFVDAGNVWFLPRHNVTKEATFRLNTFYKQIAADTGLGFRLNLGYLIARFDAGFRMLDPSKDEGKRFLPTNGFTRSDISYHIGIGYPF